mmetsp:Transcript_28167/g.34295  ORF Transcript_28167/g.34295 Transcript_28167/m.34295 type:complete len:202 (-) Transcript_28167:1577-2182(-)
MKRGRGCIKCTGKVKEYEKEEVVDFNRRNRTVAKSKADIIHKSNLANKILNNSATETDTESESEINEGEIFIISQVTTVGKDENKSIPRVSKKMLRTDVNKHFLEVYPQPQQYKNQAKEIPQSPKGVNSMETVYNNQVKEIGGGKDELGILAGVSLDELNYSRSNRNEKEEQGMLSVRKGEDIKYSWDNAIREAKEKMGLI